MKLTKMKKCLQTLAAAAMTLVMAMSAALPVLAEGTNIAPTDNLTTTFNKYLVMDKNANVPNVEFQFTITAGDAVSAKDGNPAIDAGNDSRVTGFPVLKVDGAGDLATVTTEFDPLDEAYDTEQDGDTVTLGEDQKYAKKTVTVDFSDVDFNAPGIYRYIITEIGNTQSGIANDATTTRTLDVFVEYENAENDGKLVVSNYILYPGTKTDAADETTKDDGFTNTYTTYDLTLEKQVTGNQGDRDKYFEFTVNITDAVEGTVYTVDLTDAEASPTVDGTPQTNQGTLTATEGTVNATYYLKDDRSIVIQGLTGDTIYSISEKSYAGDGYTTSYLLDSEGPVEDKDTGSKSMGTTDHKVTFTNDKTGTVPTGILLETAPYIVLVLVVLAGLAVLFATRRRRRDE